MFVFLIRIFDFSFEIVSRDEHGGDGEDSMSDSSDSERDEPKAKAEKKEAKMNLDQLDEDARNKAIITVCFFSFRMDS